MPSSAATRSALPRCSNGSRRKRAPKAISQLTFVIAESDEPTWRAYEQAGFALSTEVLEMAVDLDEPPPEPPLARGVTVRTYTDADAHAVRGLLDDAYAGWDKAYVPFTHEACSRS